MGKVKDAPLFSLLRDFLLIHLPKPAARQRQYQEYAALTVWKQLFEIYSGTKKEFHDVCYI